MNCSNVNIMTQCWPQKSTQYELKLNHEIIGAGWEDTSEERQRSQSSHTTADNSLQHRLHSRQESMGSTSERSTVARPKGAVNSIACTAGKKSLISTSKSRRAIPWMKEQSVTLPAQQARIMNTTFEWSTVTQPKRVANKVACTAGKKSRNDMSENNDQFQGIEKESGADKQSSRFYGSNPVH